MRERPLALLVLAGCTGQIGPTKPLRASDEGGQEAAADESDALDDGGDVAVGGSSDEDGALGGDAEDEVGGGGPADAWAAACPWIAEHDYPLASDAFFEPSVLTRIDLEMDPADYQWLLDNPDLEEYRPASLTVCGERLEGVGMRFKLSPYLGADLPDGYPKNPILIDLSEYAPGQKLRGLRHVDLEYGDDFLLVTERSNWELLAAQGVVASRVNSAVLTVNGAMVGVFTNVERIDKSYVGARFGDDGGNLYKHNYCGSYVWLGDDPASYADQPGCYEKKTNEAEADYSDLVHVIDVLNNTPIEELEAALPDVLDVDALLAMAAATQVLGYGDSAVGNANNFYSYHATDPDRFVLLPWDMDGGFFGGEPCEGAPDEDPIHWDLFRISACYEWLPLLQRTLEVPAWRDRYLGEALAFYQGAFAPAAYAARVREIADQLRPALAEDPYRTTDDAGFDARLDELVAQQAERSASVRDQLVAEGLEVP